MQKFKNRSQVLSSKCKALFISSFLLFPFTFFLALSPAAEAQEVVDKMVATVSSGSRANLITYSDLLWQLALQPGTPLSKPVSKS